MEIKTCYYVRSDEGAVSCTESLRKAFQRQWYVSMSWALTWVRAKQ